MAFWSKQPSVPKLEQGPTVSIGPVALIPKPESFEKHSYKYLNKDAEELLKLAKTRLPREESECIATILLQTQAWNAALAKLIKAQ